MTKNFLCLLLFWALEAVVFAQNKNDLVQFTGVVIDVATRQPILYATVFDKKIRRGAVCDENGYFSFVVHKGDSIQFSAVGYQKKMIRIPPNITKDSYSFIAQLEIDQVLLKEATIYPWPKRDEFDDAFMSVVVPDDDLQRARRNLEREELREQGKTMAMDGKENYSFQMRQNAQRMYSAGQNPYMGIFDPIAWGKFFKALSNDELFKSDKKKRPFDIDKLRNPEIDGN
ncbi:MAG: carboxypeptidase-like regulatory domain-containing protein [Chitinophagales bacterium]|jgi:hypothetical protein|nr:carboxypeptidase-like regulatory domain-containing protein [Chitinophagales bacterium]HNI44407.1 carboxypeptidase-like regulatory domain-containing protein [Chitinophagales bacterium]HNL08288.1 carboxypeptidase-like regulatory domain-containing protein [Chitinophagales bacterium]